MAIHCEWRPVSIDHKFGAHAISPEYDSLKEYLSSVNSSPRNSILTIESGASTSQPSKACKAPVWLSYLVGLLEHPGSSQETECLERPLLENIKESKGEYTRAPNAVSNNSSPSSTTLPTDRTSRFSSMASEQPVKRSIRLPTTDFHITTRRRASQRQPSVTVASTPPNSRNSDPERSSVGTQIGTSNPGTKSTLGIRLPISQITQNRRPVPTIESEQIHTKPEITETTLEDDNNLESGGGLKLDRPSGMSEAAFKMHKAKSLSIVSSDYELRNRSVTDRDPSSSPQTSSSPSSKSSGSRSQIDGLTDFRSESSRRQISKKRKVLDSPDAEYEDENQDFSSLKYPNTKTTSPRTSRPDTENNSCSSLNLRSIKREKRSQFLRQPSSGTEDHVLLGIDPPLDDHTLTQIQVEASDSQLQNTQRPDTALNSSAIATVTRKLPSLRSRLRRRHDFQDFVGRPKSEVEDDTIEVKTLSSRRRGRPKKLTDSAEVHIKRRVGRPRKLVSEISSQVASSRQQRLSSWTNVDDNDSRSFIRSGTRRARRLLDRNPGFGYGLNSKTRYHPASHRDTSTASSPRRNLRGGGGSRRRGGGNIYAGGRGKGKPRGRGGRGDSPEPPQRNGPLSPEDRILMSTLKARQQELKRFFSTIGSQQAEVLEQISGRDLNKLIRKARAHRNVPEYEIILEDIAAQKEEILTLLESRYKFQRQHEMEMYQKEKSLIEEQFKVRCENAQNEHVEGAQGDLILLRRAREAANDETRTQSGSEADYFPYYHELPEPDARVRGYHSTRITDEKPFKQYLLSYDDQARREVIDEDLINPMAKAVAEQNKDWKEEAERQKTQTLHALSAEASKELDQMKTLSIEEHVKVDEINAYALSALADVSEWVSQQQNQPKYTHVPQTSIDSLPLQSLALPTPTHQRSQSLKQNKRNTKIQPTTNGVTPKPTPALAPAPGPMMTTRTISQGLGLPIAPAPPKRSVPVPRSPVFQTSPGHTPAPSSRQSLPGQQRFVFQTPQQPLLHQSAPGPISNTASAASQGFIGQITQQAKMPVTFVNQTIASRKATAAAAANGSSGSSQQGAAKGGQRILLPKV